MHSHESVLTVIQVVVALPYVNLPYVKVKDTDGIYLFDIRVNASQSDMLGDGFGHSVEDTFQIINLAGILYFYNDNFVLTVAGFDVYPVELVFRTQLVAFALKNLQYTDILSQQYGKESLEHPKISLIPQQALRRPVKAYVSVFLFHIHILRFLQIYAIKMNDDL